MYGDDGDDDDDDDNDAVVIKPRHGFCLGLVHICQFSGIFIQIVVKHYYN